MASQVAWSPELGQAETCASMSSGSSSERSVHGMLGSWLRGFVGIGALMHRLDGEEGEGEAGCCCRGAAATAHLSPRSQPALPAAGLLTVPPPR